VDDYFSTKIYEFTTNCRACGKCEFKIRTNPKDRTFDYTVGIRKKKEDFDTAEAGARGVVDTDFGNGILEYKNGKVLDAPDANPATATNALHFLEKHVTGHRKAQTEHEHMTSLIHLNSKMVEDADANASIRANFRKDRKAKKRRLGEAAGMGLGKGIELSKGSEEDATLAKRAMNMRQRSRRDGDRSNILGSDDRIRSIRSGSIFGKQTSSKHGRCQRPKKIAGEEMASKKRVHVSGKKSAPKQMIAIHLEKPRNGAVKTTKRSLSDNGALAALSACYASDSE